MLGQLNPYIGDCGLPAACFPDGTPSTPLPERWITFGSSWVLSAEMFRPIGMAETISASLWVIAIMAMMTFHLPLERPAPCSGASPLIMVIADYASEAVFTPLTHHANQPERNNEAAQSVSDVCFYAGWDYCVSDPQRACGDEAQRRRQG